MGTGRFTRWIPTAVTKTRLGAQNYVICFERSQSCMILLTNSDNGELAFRPLLEKIFGDTVTPWEWEGYTPDYIKASRASR